VLQHLRPACVMLIGFTLITGVAYPLAITAISQIMMPEAANGSLLIKNGRVFGSNLIGQAFTSEKYFHSRPSATSDADPNDPAKTVDAPYNAASSSGSNLGPITQKLVDRVKADAETLRNAGVSGPIPVDAVTTSASGLDPHISPSNALMQVPRVARARSLPQERLGALVGEHIEGRALGIFGEPRINVLSLNLALDALRP
jgi:potassium-transporting ATPase KdpC subunit